MVKLENLQAEDVAVIQFYLNAFRRLYSPHLLPEVSLQLRAVPYAEGVMLEVTYSKNGPNLDHIDQEIRPRVDAVIRELHLEIEKALTADEFEKYCAAIAKNEMVFSGTGFLGTRDKNYIVKDYSLDQWSITAAKKDVSRLLASSYN